MASSDESASATPQLDTSKPTATPLSVHIVTFHAENWSHGVKLLDGRPPTNEHQGTLGAYPTHLKAEDVAVEWTLRQVRDHIRKDIPSLKTEEDREAEFDKWEGSESTQVNPWWYMVSKGAEGLQVKIEKAVLFDPFHHPGSSDRGRARTVGGQGNRTHAADGEV